MDKTIRHVKQALGTIKRLSAAVVINQRKEPGKDGKLVNKPLPEAEVKQINDLVKEAMGFSNERGDTLSVANAPFTVVEKDDSLPVWRDPETRSIAIELFKYAAIAAIIAYLLLGVVRPLVRTMLPPPPIEETLGGRVDVVAGGEDEENIEEEGENVVLTAAELLEKKIAELRALAQQDPHIVAAIIKEWMGANGS